MDGFKKVLDTEGQILIDQDAFGEEIYYLYNEADDVVVQGPRYLEAVREIQEAETEPESGRNVAEEQSLNPEITDQTKATEVQSNDPQTTGAISSQISPVIIYISSDSDENSTVDQHRQILQRHKKMVKRGSGENQHLERGKRDKRRRVELPIDESGASTSSGPRGLRGTRTCTGRRGTKRCTAAALKEQQVHQQKKNPVAGKNQQKDKQNADNEYYRRLIANTEEKIQLRLNKIALMERRRMLEFSTMLSDYLQVTAAPGVPENDVNDGQVGANNQPRPLSALLEQRMELRLRLLTNQERLKMLEMMGLMADYQELNRLRNLLSY